MGLTGYLKNKMLKYSTYLTFATYLLTSSCGDRCGELGCDISGKKPWKDGKGIEVSEPSIMEKVGIVGGEFIREGEDIGKLVMRFSRQNGDTLVFVDNDTYLKFYDNNTNFRNNIRSDSAQISYEIIYLVHYDKETGLITGIKDFPKIINAYPLEPRNKQ